MNKPEDIEKFKALAKEWEGLEWNLNQPLSSEDFRKNNDRILQVEREMSAMGMEFDENGEIAT